VLVLRNFGLLVGGETVEEAFWLSRNVMTGVDTQVPLSPASVLTDQFYGPHRALTPLFVCHMCMSGQ